MLTNLDILEKGFREIFKKSKEECGDELEKLRNLILFTFHFYRVVRKHSMINKEKFIPKFTQSLVGICFLELTRNSGHILFLSSNGLYRNAFNNIRYALESIVQTLYLDQRHPKIDIKTKIEILKEVEDKREYHAMHLIDELEIGYKRRLKKEYRKLSQIIHPTHRQILTTISDILKGEGIPTTVSCKEISKIYDSMKIMYDIFFFLFLNYFSEIKEPLILNLNIIKEVKYYKFYLLSKILKIRYKK